MSALARLLILSFVLLLALVAAGVAAQFWLQRQEARILDRARTDLRAQVQAAITLTGGADAPWTESRLDHLSAVTGSELTLHETADFDDDDGARGSLARFHVSVPVDEQHRLVASHPAPAGERILSLFQRVLIALGVFALVLLALLIFLLAARSLRQRNDTRPPFASTGRDRDLSNLSLLAHTSARQQAALDQERDERLRAETEARDRLQLLNHVLEEKIRTGRDLHDGVIQTLYAAGLNLQSAHPASENAATTAATSQLAAERTDAAITLINRAIADIRNYIGGLTPRQVRRDALAQGLTLAFGDLRAGRPATLELQIDDAAAAALSDEQLSESMQIAREAMSNALRHGGADRLRITLNADDAGTTFAFHDNGTGFDPATIPATGHGLANIRGRAARADGRVTLTSARGEGTCLAICWHPTVSA